MSQAWRLCTKRHARTAFSGNGARRFAGRWNDLGTPIVYVSETLSLAALELLVHFDTDLAPEEFVAISVEIPQSVRLKSLTVERLPRDWKDYPAGGATKIIGKEWIASGKSVGLWVPSAVVPQERNLLLNPAHADFRKLKIGRPSRFHFDPRLTS